MADSPPADIGHATEASAPTRHSSHQQSQQAAADLLHEDQEDNPLGQRLSVRSLRSSRRTERVDRFVSWGRQVTPPERPLQGPLAELEGQMMEVLALQRQMDRNVSELVSGLLHRCPEQLGHLSSGGQPHAQSAARKAPPGPEAGPETRLAVSPVWKSGNSAHVEENQSIMVPVGLLASERHSSTLSRSASSPLGHPSATLAPCFAGAFDDLADEEVDAELFRLLGDGRPGQESSLFHTAKVQDGRTQSYIMDPHGEARITHDTFSIVALGADILTIPIVLAWNIKEDGFLKVLRTISFGFWTFDLCMNFCTGVWVQGELETRKWQLAKRYLATWFVLDLCIILVDIVFFLLADILDATEARGATIFRAGKVVRLFRIVRTSRVIRRVAATSTLPEICLKVVMPASAIILVNHLFACMWWSISTYFESDTGYRWVTQPAGPDGVSFVNAGFSYQYLTCIHWSIAQLTLGSMDVAPVNALERAFTCVALLAGVFAFSTLISWLSAEMMRYYLKQNDKLTKLAVLRRFLIGRVRPGVCIAALYQAKVALTSNSGKPDTIGDIAAVAVLPQAVQRKLREELCCKHFRHPLLRWWYSMDCQGVKGLCHSAVDFVGLAGEDNLFFPRTDAIGAYIMTCGSALYFQESDGGHRMLRHEVLQDRFFCEVALWCKWKHVGELTASIPSELLSITAAGLFHCLDSHRISRHVVLHYAKRYHQRLTVLLSGGGERPNDIVVPFTEFDSILSSLPASCRELIGAVAVCVAKQQKGRSCVNESQVEEVREGKCCLMVNWNGEVERIVMIVVLRLVSRDDRVLTQIAEWKGEKAQVSCKLPGKKLREGQDTDEALSQLMKNGLCAPFADLVHFTGAELQVTWKESTRMDTKTKYLKTVHHAELLCPVGSLDVQTVGVQRVIGASTSTTPHLVAKQSSTASLKSGGSALPFPLEDLELFVLADGAGQVTIVSWLLATELQYYTSAEGEERLKGMLEQMRLEPDAVAGAKVRYATAASRPGDSDIVTVPVPSL